ncbi:MAG: twin-arginine translocase subunit TatC, partial [Verrucomicrobia bacterium]|nr:twin-arginine translocase subunit TatC [Verrucomicrobiota bacterium]
TIKDQPKPVLEHLADESATLRGRLAAWGIAMAIVMPFAPRLFTLLRAPLAKITEPPEQFLRSLEITGGFSIALQIILWGGLLVSAPFITFLIARFVLPGLTCRERKVIVGSLGFVIALFSLGVGIAYFITLPVALKIMFGLHTWLGIRAEWTAVNYVAFAVKLLMAFGLAFELPVIVVVLGYLGIVSAAFLRSKRRHVIVIILILAMLLTPGPDIFSQIVMAVPMLLLYEACIWIVWLAERKRTAKDLKTDDRQQTTEDEPAKREDG